MCIRDRYRDVYGVQPKYNRLYLEPHLIPQLNGTRLKYRLRQQLYEIDLSTNEYRMQAKNFGVATKDPFGMNVAGNTLEYFHADRRSYSMKLTRMTNDPVNIVILNGAVSSADYRRWRESCSNPKETIDHLVADLKPDNTYAVHKDGRLLASVRSNARGEIRFRSSGGAASHVFEVKR